MSLEIPKSNFRFIELNFSDIVLEIRDGANNFPSERRFVRKTIIFHDMSKMYCNELLDDTESMIESYWYDWYDDGQQLIMKFHAHYHKDGTPHEITIFDPFHIQTDNKRIKNEKFKELIVS